ncbi:MAG TPA: calcium-binding protein, partial [Candidatus Sulfotelmatobacter sp.]|nr:calcium-binding protein [Candidatus Sulfotelmatobacter sp.]
TPTPTPPVVPVTPPVTPATIPATTPINYAPTTNLTHTVSLTTAAASSTFIGTAGADTFIGSTAAAYTFIGHGGADYYVLGAHTNLLVLDGNAHAEVIKDSVTSGAADLVDASALNGGFNGASVDASGDLVVAFDRAAGGGSMTLLNYFNGDSNVLTVIGGNSDYHTFLKDDVGASSVVMGTGEMNGAAYNAIVGTTGNDIIIGATGDLVMLGGSGVLSGGDFGKDIFILGGLGGAVVGGNSGENELFLNALPSGLTIDLTDEDKTGLWLGGHSLDTNWATDGNKTTALYNIETVHGTNHGDTFVGGRWPDGDATRYDQEFYAGTGANTIVDTVSVYSEGNRNQEHVLVSYEASQTGITADLSAFDGNSTSSYYWSGGVTEIAISGLVYHDGVTDYLYGVSRVQGSAGNDVMIASSYGAYFLSSLGNDSYHGNGFNGLSTSQYYSPVELSYYDSASVAEINLTGSAISVTEVLSSGTVTLTLNAYSALHDFSGSTGYTDSLDNFEEVQLSRYGGHVYGDGSTVLDLGSGSTATVTVNLSSGVAWGWQAGASDHFQNMAGVLAEGGASDFIVTSAALQASTIWGNSGTAVLDLTALNGSVYLLDEDTSGIHSGTAYLVHGETVSVLTYGGITDLETGTLISDALVISANSIDLSGSGSGLTVDMVNHELIGSDSTALLLGALPTASGDVSDFLVLPSTGLTTLKGSRDQIEGIICVEGSGGSLALEFTDATVHLAGLTAATSAAKVVLDASHASLYVDNAGVVGNNSILGVAFADGSTNDLLVSSIATILDVTLAGGHGGTLDGGSGNDIFRINEAVGLTIDGGDGKNWLYADSSRWGDTGYTLPTTGLTLVMADDGASGHVYGAGGESLNLYNIDVVVGSYRNDTLIGAENAVNSLIGNGGIDTVIGGNLGDYLVSSGGTVLGGGGDDTLIATIGNNSLYGGDGNDLLMAGSGADTLWGGGGANTLIGGSGTAVMIGGDGGSTMIGGSGTEIMMGGAGNDTFIGGSHSTVDYHAVSDGVTVNMITGVATGASIGTDTLTDIFNVAGSAGNDVFVASSIGSYVSLDPSQWTMTTTAAYSDAQSITQIGGNTLVLYQHDYFSYAESGGSSDWNYDTTATTSGTIKLTWNFSGFDAWFQAHADAYFYDLTTGQTVHWTTTDETSSLVVNAGDVVGFRITAGNYDSTDHIYNYITVVMDTYSLDGGAGTDTLELTGAKLTDDAFAAVSNFEALKVDAATTVVLAAHAETAGLHSVDLSGDANLAVFDVSGTTGDLSFTVTASQIASDTIIGGSGIANMHVSGTAAAVTTAAMTGNVSKIDVLTLDSASDTATIDSASLANILKSSNAVTHQSGSLIIGGVAGATVNLTGDSWTSGGTVNETVNGVSHSYTVYNNSDNSEHVYVNTDLTVHAQT